MEPTSLRGSHALVVEEEVSKVVAVRIDVGLTAQARRVEVRERLQRPQSGLAFGDGRRRTSHWQSTKSVTPIITVPVTAAAAATTAATTTTATGTATAAAPQLSRPSIEVTYWSPASSPVSGPHIWRMTCRIDEQETSSAQSCRANKQLRNDWPAAPWWTPASR